MTHISPVVAVILTLLTCSVTGTFLHCTWTKVLSNGEVHYSFLRGDPSSLRLYHSVWSSLRTPRSCSFSDNAALIEKYIALCQKNMHEFSHQPDLSFMFDEERLCTSLDFPRIAAHEEHTAKRQVRSADPIKSQKERPEVKSKLRIKREFIVPGTLWCGSGNKAPSYGDVGLFSETDKCCREHDQCQDTILSFHYKFGVFNSNIFTMSHCNCDKRFRSCLMEAQDSISGVVGYTFFNLLKMHCFEFSHRLQCAQRNWFGMCKETQMALYAEVYPPTLYETDAFADVNATSFNTTLPTPVTNITQSLLPVTAESTVATPLRSTLSVMSDPSVIPKTDTTVRAQGSTTVVPGSNHTWLLLDADIKEKQKSCAIYKNLDECRNRILPLQRKYGFRNNESRTIYDCNCTNRLSQSLDGQTVLTEVHTLLLAHVSQSCFLLQNCTAGKICTVVIARTQLSQVEASRGAHVKKQRHLQAIGLRVRRPNLKRAARKVRSPNLHRLCLRMLKVHKDKRQQTKESARKRLE